MRRLLRTSLYSTAAKARSQKSLCKPATGTQPRILPPLSADAFCSYIHSNVSLVAETKGNTGGKFNVVARSSNSPVDVKFDTAPIDSVLHVDVHTSNSPARLTLHPTFEGSFSLHTGAWFPTTVQQRNEDEEDPAGKDRKRTLELRTIRRGSTEGSVAWTPSEREELGTAVLTSSNSPVALYL